MKQHLTLLIVSLLILAGCSKPPSDSTPTPERVDFKPYIIGQNASGAILTRFEVIVYFVGSSNSLIQVAVPVPDADQAKARVPIGSKHGASAALSTGPNVVKYVIPTGGASPVPPIDQAAYSHREATGGFITYSCTTPKGKLPPECTVVLSIDQLDFDNGVLYSIDEQTFTAYSPPP